VKSRSGILRELIPGLEKLIATLVRQYAPRSAQTITISNTTEIVLAPERFLPLRKSRHGQILVITAQQSSVSFRSSAPELIIQVSDTPLSKTKPLMNGHYETVEQFNYGLSVLPILWMRYLPAGSSLFKLFFALELRFHPYVSLITGLGSISVYRKRLRNEADACTLSLVVPAYNEENRLPPYLDNITAYLKKIKIKHEVIVVDDGSKDQTFTIASQFKSVRTISLYENFGKGAAVREGVLAARGRMVLVTDADGSTPIEDFTRLKEALDQGSDAAIGSRYVSGSDIAIKQSLFRRIISRSGNFLIRSLLGLDFRDTQCGFKLFERRAATYLFRNLSNLRFGFDFEVLKKADVIGLKVSEVPVRWSDVSGSKVTFRQTFKVFKELMRFRFGHLAKFALIGTINTIVDFAIHNTLIFSLGSTTATRQLIYMIISFLCANWVAFSLHSGYTFRRRAAYGRFFMVSVFTLSIAAMLFHGLNLLYNPHSDIVLTNLLKLSTVMVSFITNFFGYKFWVYRYAI